MKDEPIMYDVDAEAGVVCGFIMRPEMRMRMKIEVPTDAIVHAPYRAIWVLANRMHDAGEVVDPTTIKRELRRDRSIHVNPNEIVDLFGEHASSPDADVRRVIEWQTRRWAVKRSQSLYDAAVNLTMDINVELELLAKDATDRARAIVQDEPRAGGFERVRARFEAIIDGTICNLDWPDAPMLSQLVRPLQSGSITMLGGDPGDGKSFWIVGTLVQWMEQGAKAAVCMLEKTDDWHLQRAVAIATSNPDVLDDRWGRRFPQKLRAELERSRPLIERLEQSIFEARQVGSTLPELARWIDRQADKNDVVIVDPISLAEVGAEGRWVADGDFIRSCIRTCERTNTRVVLVTHPNSQKGPKGLTSIMGGQAYTRATDSVLYIEKLDPPKRFDVVRRTLGTNLTANGVSANRLITAFKARNGVGGARRYAFNMDPCLRFVEQGLIVRECDDDDEDDRRDAAETATRAYVDAHSPPPPEPDVSSDLPFDMT